MSETAIAVLDPTEAARANVFYVLARILEAPSDWDPDLPELVSRAFEPMPEPLPGLGADLADQLDRLLEDPEPAAVDHARLFLGPFEILAAPWASFYLDDVPRIMGPASEYAARAYAAAGLAPAKKLREAPDHVTHELEFMYFLAFQGATTRDAVWADRQSRFWREHLGQWLPRFADAVADADVHPVYAALAATIKETCALEG